EQKTIIPSDYQMIAQFGKTAVSMPLVEADMIRYGGGEVEKFPDLVKFERFNHSLKQAKAFLGKMVTVEMDRPMGSMHPTDGFEYPVNYGYLPNVLAPDGDALDAYVLGVAEPLNRFNGRCTAIIHRLDDDDDKLVVVPDGVQMSDAEILTAVSFQEQYFQSRVVRD
ncbi:MAG: inorganic diphosphatase, partial [Chloroflexota bacterium]